MWFQVSWFRIPETNKLNKSQILFILSNGANKADCDTEEYLIIF